MAARMEKKGWKVVAPSRLKTFNASRTSPVAAGKSGATKCINCGGAHATRDCSRARVEESDRPCWGCGQKGHKRSACPTSPSIPRRNVPARQAAEEESERAMTCAEEGPRQPFSRPRALQLGDFIRDDARIMISDDAKQTQKTDGAVRSIVQASYNSCLHEHTTFRLL